ncbi:unnamed protein product [[Actinomadura] parvosata subsp. kistnae]|uniref:Uncharacterized protein n=1 Tax=[Actinomadura] parvosata subsp. kistnae TaxID=1909395 RepID=A0A1V0ABQ1_9ACTN|nr:hypothetical protein [Nonomuraea sp. ATCC 55076]AQZ67641.1 hypothetical protein BKM31_44790 [Nonomuraea sp. ATCC 55076]SPL94072.1 unnamed protein product [Actinomadura parvosata subsp. kistnae]
MGADRTLRLELDVCAAYGIPHSTFLSWPEDDRDKALWHHIWKQQECPNCRTRPDEWDETKGGHRYAYIAEPRQCRGCQVKEGAQEAFEGSKDRGVHIVLIRNEEVLRRADA